VINDITEQTNLLALNAALKPRAQATQAAVSRRRGRSAQAGRTLRSATKDIAALIKAIQAETNEAVVVMEEGTKEVEGGASLADQAGRALDAISTVVRQSAELVQEISLASNNRYAVRKASLTRCRLFPALRARLRKVLAARSRRSASWLNCLTS